MPAVPHLMVGTPCYGGVVTVKYHSSALALIRESEKRGIPVEFVHLSNSSLITHARNRLVAIFLANPQFSHLLFIDADQGYEPNQVFRLLECEAEVVAAVSPKKIVNWEKIERAVKAGRPPATAGLDYVVNFKSDGLANARNGFAQVSVVGTGFMLIARSAIKKLCAGHPELRSWVEPADQATGNYFGLFDCVIDEKTGAALSEDLSFCKRWAELGGEIWVDMFSKITHTGPVTFEGDLASQYRVQGQ